MMEDISEEDVAFAVLDGEMQSQMLFRSNGAGWKYSWDFLGVSGMYMVSNTLIDQGIGVSCAALLLLTTLRSPRASSSQQDDMAFEAYEDSSSRAHL